MKKLVLFSEGGFHQVYQSRLKKYRVKQEFVVAMQIFGLVMGIVFCLLMFLLFGNKASTKGHDYRLANYSLSATTSRYNSIKTSLMKMQRDSRDKLDDETVYTSNTTIETLTIPAPQT